MYALLRTCLSLIICSPVLVFAGCGSEFGVLHDKVQLLPDLNAGNELRIFWSEENVTTGFIKKTNINRNNEITLSTTTGKPLDIALYIPGQKIYCAEDYLGISYLILYADLDGTNDGIFTLYTSAPNHGPSEIAIDSEAGIIYWNRYQSLSSHNDIWRSNISALSAEKWVNDIPHFYAFSVDLDTANKKIYISANTYWDIGTPIGSGQEGGMYIADMNTVNSYSAPFTASGPSSPSVPLRGIAVDSAGGHVYYVSNTAAGLAIIQTDLSLLNPTVWITASGFDIQKLALDLRERKIYWTSRSPSGIYRANMGQAESGVEQFLQLSGTPTGIDILN